MTLAQLHYVITISDTKSINKAAEILYVSQPSLTNAIKELEKELGITIFNRSGKGVTLTGDGEEFLINARQLYSEYQSLSEKYITGKRLKKKFAISTQHYSFAVKAFVEMVKEFDASEYEFAIRETKTREVISDVASLHSEVGILYLSEFNKRALTKLFKSNDLEFHPLINCNAYVYVWKNHPIAKETSVNFEKLKEYPCLSFEQGDKASLYYAEEIFSDNYYPQIIKVNDRSSMLNLMVGLNGYTLCSGIICEELNGTDHVAVPLSCEDFSDETMHIGYITRKNMKMSNVGTLYIDKIKQYLKIE